MILRCRRHMKKPLGTVEHDAVIHNLIPVSSHTRKYNSLLCNVYISQLPRPEGKAVRQLRLFTASKITIIFKIKITSSRLSTEALLLEIQANSME